jgi:hypothetical protein
MSVWTWTTSPPARFLAPAVFVAGLLPFTLGSYHQHKSKHARAQLLIKTFFGELISKTNNPIHIHTCDSSC